MQSTNYQKNLYHKSNRYRKLDPRNAIPVR